MSALAAPAAAIDAREQEAGDIVARLQGRARYIRDQGGIKSVEVMEAAVREIKKLRGEA